MDHRQFESTSLWRRTLAPFEGDDFEVERARLRSAYESMRRNSAIISGQIQRDIPSLTLHDVNHLDSLWTTADLIAGSNYPLTPAEAFIFGSSVLVHDAGHAVAAYPDGIESLKKTPEWRDAVVSALEETGEQRITEEKILAPPNQAMEKILFNVLRRLHSRRAEELAFYGTKSKSSGSTIYLLEDNELRNSYGALIGLVAASHHWNLDQVVSSLQKRVGAIAGLPGNWHIDPVKIACLLRCADAAQIDMRRAPDFLFSLLDIRGISADHWRAQNKLAQPIQDPDDETALLFSSTGPYRQAEADAWWVAWDLISIVNNELQASSSLLKNTNRPAFQLSRVRDADSIERLSTHITTSGWKPVLAEVSASDPVKLASILGGKELYGYAPMVPIRELIQNASDAVRARAVIDGNKGDLGRISLTIRREMEEGDEFLWIDVEDNGVGMSESVMSGPLLDFGVSLWSDRVIEAEFPGLKGALFQPTGKFGIGFYSVFMIADIVHVVSRRFDSGINKVRKLIFRAGLKQRPIIVDAEKSDISPSFQTRVSFRIKKDSELDFKEYVLSEDVGPESQTVLERVSFAERVSQLAPMVDCDIYVTDLDGQMVLAHSREWFKMPSEEWLRRITLADVYQNPALDRAIQEAAPRLRLICKGGRVTGRAAIARSAENWYDFDFPTPLQPGIVTHGGLSAKPAYAKKTSPFVGAIEMQPQGAYRFSEAVSGEGFYFDLVVADKISMDEWFFEQDSMLDTEMESARTLLSLFVHFAQMGYFSEKHIVLRRYGYFLNPSNLEQIELLSLDDIISDCDSNVFRFFTLDRFIVPFVYYDEEEIAALREFMKEHELYDFYFSPIDVSEVNSYSSIEDPNAHGYFLGALRRGMERKRFVVQIQHFDHRSSLRKPFFLDGVLEIRYDKIE